MISKLYKGSIRIGEILDFHFRLSLKDLSKTVSPSSNRTTRRNLPAAGIQAHFRIKDIEVGFNCTAIFQFNLTQYSFVLIPLKLIKLIPMLWQIF